jgi:hypothetical protein
MSEILGMVDGGCVLLVDAEEHHAADQVRFGQGAGDGASAHSLPDKVNGPTPIQTAC